MDGTSQSLDVIVQRIAKLEAKVAAFEAKYGPLDALEETRPDQETADPAHQQIPQQQLMPSMSTLEPTTVDWERVGRVWLPIAFIIAILMGVAFLFDAAIKAGLLNQQARLAVGYVGSAAVLGVGELQLARSRRVLGDVLIGASIAIMLLTTFAGNHLYHILSTPIAVALGLLFTAAGAYLANRHRSQTLAVIATLGGSLIVLMLSIRPADPVFVALYALVVSIGFVWFAMAWKFRGAFFVAWLMLHFDLCVFVLTTGHVDAVFAWVALAQHIAVAAYLFVRRPAAGERYAMFYPSLAVTGLWSLGLTHVEARLEFLLLGLAYVGVASVFHFRKQARDGLHVAFLGALFAVALFFAYALHGENQVLAFILEGSVGLLTGLWLRLGAQMWMSCLLYAIAWLFVLSVAPGGTRVYLLFGKFVGEDFVIDLLATASAVAVVVIATRLTRGEGEQDRTAKSILRVFWWFAPAVVILFLSNSLLTVLQSFHSDLKMLAVSFLWAILAVILVIVGVRRDTRRERAMGILLLFITLAKLVVVDLPFVPIVLRAVLFIGVGAIGVFASRLFYGIGKK
ncbi:DUF2339 domain-containing protein [Alicyclobacillus sp. ALC3]|uniref:DUF2339 domain-containing protein n=1 Tax=Alicyclobacillus sp. ALC3 TaxID=2796143 RepID=UPI002379854D|nr:DUF2339 domain-containing protein [Alicyclobacillus sp. ALC3]WDL98308.1 DUF2339 domain-containing protein [Alicyclobacillus sp. ALC3]